VWYEVNDNHSNPEIDDGAFLSCGRLKSLKSCGKSVVGELELANRGFLKAYRERGKKEET
jgi:hypothetical protein